jgi:Zn-finger nucleic acid-binding protein
MTFMCPSCDEAMVLFELEGVEIDRCLKCGGTWLDAGELELLAGSGKLAEALFRGAGEAHGGRPCVRCRAELRLLRVDGIEVDRCPRGHGLWLDRGELEKLIATCAEGEDARVARFLGDLTAAERKKGGSA